MIRFSQIHLNHIDARYICPDCKYIFEQIVHQLDCGCRLCSLCSEKFTSSVCKYCNERISPITKKIDKAFMKEVANLKFNCSICESFEGNIAELKSHEKEKHEKYVCKFCNQKTNKNESHICSNEMIDCIYSDIGCKVKITLKNLEEHELDNLKAHLDLLKKFVLEQFKLETDEPIDNVKGNQELTSSLLINKDKNVTALGKGIKIIEDSINKLSNESSRYQYTVDKLTKELNEFKEKTKNSMEETNSRLSNLQARCVVIDERINSLDIRSYDGELIWKITNFNERRNDAKIGRQTSFYSPIFYSSRYGYRMCARIYLNGDGMGRNTHLSLFFVILRGEYDALLKWPFQQKVSFVLIDQSDKKQHIIDTFKPDPNSNSFKRPTTDMNIASGIPLYCPLNKVLSPDSTYVKDNVMFVQVIVDTLDLAAVDSRVDLLKKNFSYDKT